MPSCAQIGLPALAFTKHLDLTGWVIDPEVRPESLPVSVSRSAKMLAQPLKSAALRGLLTSPTHVRHVSGQDLSSAESSCLFCGLRVPGLRLR